MNPRITAMENLIASDPGGRNVFGLVVPDQLRLAAQSLRLARRVGLVSGFYVADAGAGETDGPPGAKIVGEALRKIGVEVDYITDSFNAPLFEALAVEPITSADDYLRTCQPTHLVAVERAGRGRDGRYRNMRARDITATTAPLDELFLEAARLGLTTIGIGDGGNEIGMGRVFAEALEQVNHGRDIACVVSTDFCIAAGVSNWGAYGLAGALSILAGRDLIPSSEACFGDLQSIVRDGGAVDGVNHRREPTVDGLDWSYSLRMLESIRQLIVPSPLERRDPITVGILGYGESGRAAATLLARQGHRVCISDVRSVTLDEGLVVAGVETGGHSIRFLAQCDLVVVSPGVAEDAPIRNELYARGIPLVSELELAYQLCPYDLIAVTGTIGKRTTVELLRDLFHSAGVPLTIGGNKGRPLSALLCDALGDAAPRSPHHRIALAVSSFQLESVVHFRPHVAVVLNINEAHLDRHRTVAEYVRIKSRVFMNHRPDDELILPYDDPRLRPLARKHHGRTFFVSSRQAVDRGAWLDHDAVVLNPDAATQRIAVESSRGDLKAHPENLLSALLAARLSGIDVDALDGSLKGLQGK